MLKCDSLVLIGGVMVRGSFDKEGGLGVYGVIRDETVVGLLFVLRVKVF